MDQKGSGISAQESGASPSGTLRKPRGQYYRHLPAEDFDRLIEMTIFNPSASASPPLRSTKNKVLPSD